MSDSGSDGWESDENTHFGSAQPDHPGSSAAAVNTSVSAAASDAAASALAAVGPLAPVTITVGTKSTDTETRNRRRVKRLSPLERLSRETSHQAELLGLLAAQVHQLRLMHSPHIQANILSRIPADIVDQLSFEPSSGCPWQSSLERFVAWFRFSTAVQNYCVPASDSALNVARLEAVANGSSISRDLNPHALVSGLQLELVLVFGALLLSLGVRVRLVSSLDPNAVSGAARFDTGIGWAHSTLNSRFGLSAAKSTARASRGSPSGSADIVDVRSEEQATRTARQRAGGVSTSTLRSRNAAHGALVWLEVLAVPESAAACGAVAGHTGSSAAGKAAGKGPRKQAESKSPRTTSAHWMHVDMLREWVDAPAQVHTLRAKQYPLAYVLAVSVCPAAESPPAQHASAFDKVVQWDRLQYSAVGGPRLCGLQLRDVTQRYAASTAAALKWRKACGTSDWWRETISALNAAWLPSLLRSCSRRELSQLGAQHLMALLHGLVLMMHGSGTWGEHRTEYSFEHILRAGLQAAGTHLGIALGNSSSAADAAGDNSDVELLDSDSDEPAGDQQVSGGHTSCAPWASASAAAAARADAAETSELALAKQDEPLPTTKAAFKTHPKYALESLCSTTEVIHPNGPEHSVGVFKGEPVFPRRLVQRLLTKERWLMEHGRSVRSEEIDAPAKTTVKRIRPPSVRGGRRGSGGLFANPGLTRSSARGEAGGGAAHEKTVSLYGEWQTEVHKPEEVSPDGKIPVNSYGNVEVWGGRSDMVPLGAVHLTGMPGAGRIASQLGFDWARAVVGFDRKAGMMVPKTDGIVIPAVAEDAVVEAWEQADAAKVATAAKKRASRAIRNWTKLAKGSLTMVYIRERRAASNAVGPATSGPDADQDQVRAGTNKAEVHSSSSELSSDDATNAGTVSTLLPRRRLRKRGRLDGAADCGDDGDAGGPDGSFAAASPQGKKAARGVILDSSSDSSSASGSANDSNDQFADSAVFGTDGKTSDESEAAASDSEGSEFGQM